MGVKCAPDIFQHIINNLFSDLDFVQAYLDDILITSSDSFEDHLEKLDIVLTQLAEVGFHANLRKITNQNGQQPPSFNLRKQVMLGCLQIYEN